MEKSSSPSLRLCTHRFGLGVFNLLVVCSFRIVRFQGSRNGCKAKLSLIHQTSINRTPSHELNSELHLCLTVVGLVSNCSRRTTIEDVEVAVPASESRGPVY